MGYSLIHPLEILGGETIICKAVKNELVLDSLIKISHDQVKLQTFTKPLIEKFANEQ